MTVGTWNGRVQPETDLWGPWQAVMEEAVNCCEQQVQRLEDALLGRTSEDLARFCAEASTLFGVSSELTERCEDYGRWIAARRENEERTVLDDHIEHEAYGVRGRGA